MSFEIAMMGLVGFGCMGLFYWDQLFQQNAVERRWFIGWFVRGAFIPVMIWGFFNTGFFGLPPILPDVEVARKALGGSWVPVLLKVTARGAWVIGSYWCAISFCLLTILLFRRIERKKFFTIFAVCSLLTLPLAIPFLFSRGLSMSGFAFLFWLLPAVHFLLPVLEVKEKVIPTYSVAMGKMQMGRYDEAEMEVIKQLEMCEEDFDGWMMLAALYAEQHKDLPVAEKTVFELCAQPNANMSQVSAALHRLADWHLKLAEDPVAARRVLGEIGKRFPGSHVAKMAELRLKQTPATREDLLEQKVPRALHLPSIGARLFEGREGEKSKLDDKEATALANKLAAKLKVDPNDVRNREEFARLLAEHFGKADPAIEQIKLLLEMPEQPFQKRAEWFGLLASWEMKYRHDSEAARKFLEKVVRDFPKTPQAFAAHKQLNLMEVEARLKKAKVSLPEERPKIQVG